MRKLCLEIVMWKLCLRFQPAGLLHKAQSHCPHDDGHRSFKMNPPVSFPQSLSPPPLQALFLWRDPGPTTTARTGTRFPSYLVSLPVTALSECQIRRTATFLIIWINVCYKNTHDRVDSTKTIYYCRACGRVSG